VLIGGEVHLFDRRIVGRLVDLGAQQDHRQDVGRDDPDGPQQHDITFFIATLEQIGQHDRQQDVAGRADVDRHREAAHVAQIVHLVEPLGLRCRSWVVVEQHGSSLMMR